MYPSYSPDIAPIHYRLFRSLQNSLNGTNLVLRATCGKYLFKFFNQKPQKFYTDGIRSLPENGKILLIIENILFKFFNFNSY